MLNEIIRLHHAFNDQANLKQAIENFKKMNETKNLVKTNEKELTLKNVEGLHTGR